MRRSNRARLAFLLIFGLGGVAILCWLGTWQVQRLNWKLGLIEALETRLDAAPVPLPEAPTEAEDEYLRVTVPGVYDGSELHVLTSAKPWGPGYRVIAGFDAADGRRIMVDRGFVEESRRNETRPGGPAEVTGALLWPQEVDGFVPDPDLAENLWFARDVPPMAEALGAAPILVVAEANEADWPKAQPLTVNLRNDHLNYAITWFGLALVWAGMTGALALRLKRRGEV
ncbi:surfeit locus 1 family protein [Albimonas donghaensis]|uniref:SURF1-like protein n=1 Tax=Albimonas donghaensis TaxID=356660 RepID=A0A1H2VQ68_9RHOB|nr:SURF1 family protein [Albimonas donghaensis]SDW70430.1 surfeit locus 1 family protein [Albimonas donghaensis]